MNDLHPDYNLAARIVGARKPQRPKPAEPKTLKTTEEYFQSRKKRALGGFFRKKK